MLLQRYRYLLSIQDCKLLTSPLYQGRVAHSNSSPVSTNTCSICAGFFLRSLLFRSCARHFAHKYHARFFRFCLSVFGPSQQPNMQIWSASSDPNNVFSFLSSLFFSSKLHITLFDVYTVVVEKGYSYVYSFCLTVLFLYFVDVWQVATRYPATFYVQLRLCASLIGDLY